MFVQKLKSLSTLGKIGSTAAVIAIISSLFIVVSSYNKPEPLEIADASTVQTPLVDTSNDPKGVLGATTDKSTAQAPATTTSTATTSTRPVRPASSTRHEMVFESQPIAFTEIATEDPQLSHGEIKIVTPGSNGVNTTTYKVTYNGGKEIARELVSSVVTQSPTTQIIAVGPARSTDNSTNAKGEDMNSGSSGIPDNGRQEIKPL